MPEMSRTQVFTSGLIEFSLLSLTYFEIYENQHTLK